MTTVFDGNPGGRLLDVNASSHQVYTREPGRRAMVAPPDERTRWRLKGKYGFFVVQTDVEGRSDPSFRIRYQLSQPAKFTGRTGVSQAAFLRVVRTGHHDELDKSLKTLEGQSLLRTDAYSGYRVDRAKRRSPFSGQKDPKTRREPFELSSGTFIDMNENSHEAMESDNPHILDRMLRSDTLFCRFEAITALLDISTGLILDAVEWGAHVERDNLNETGTCTVYTPSLLEKNVTSSTASLREHARERRTGLKLAMAQWNNDYALFVEKLFTEPRFAFLSEWTTLGYIKQWHNAGDRIIEIPGEQDKWVYPANLLRGIVPPEDESGGPIKVSPKQRPLAVFPLQVPKPPPDSREQIGTSYCLSVPTIISELKKLGLAPREIAGTAHPLWVTAKVRLERSGKTATDWTILTEILDALNEKFKTAAKAARRKLEPPPQGYVQRGYQWLREHYGDAIGAEVPAEDEDLSPIERDDLIGEILRDTGLTRPRDVAQLLKGKGIDGLLNVCNELWQVYTLECGPPGSVLEYSATFVDHAPMWFRHLQANMHWFYRATSEMLDPGDELDGSQSDPLPSPVSRGFLGNGIGFVVDGRSFEMIEASKAIIPAISYKPPSFNMAKEMADEAERLHPVWAFLTHITKGNAFFWRDRYELDYQTAVIASRSTGGLFRFVREKGFIHAAEVPKQGVDLEAAQRYLAAVWKDPSKIARVGEKAYPRISSDKLLASIAVEVAGEDTLYYPTFYRYVGDWTYTRFAQKKSVREYISAATPPAFLPVPLCCYEEFRRSFIDARFKEDPIHLGGLVGIPLHMWNDLQTAYHRLNIGKDEAALLNENQLLAIDQEFTEEFKQVQKSTLLSAELERRKFVKLIEEYGEEATAYQRMRHLVEYPAWFLNFDKLKEAKDFLRDMEERGTTSEISDRHLNSSWDSVCGPQVELNGFNIHPPFEPPLNLPLHKLQYRYFRKLEDMMDPDAEKWRTIDFEATQVRWPVSPRPMGFKTTLIAFFVAHPTAFKDGELVPEFSKKGRLAAAWKDLAIQNKDFVWNNRTTSLIPESCIFVSRTFEGALMTAKPTNKLGYDQDVSTAARVYAMRIKGGTIGFDLERFQLDAVSVPTEQLRWDALPGVKALGLQSSLKESDILGSIPIQRLDLNAIPKLRSVTTFGAGIENPRQLPVLFQFRLLQPLWDIEPTVTEADKQYLEKALPKTWFPSIPAVDGRVHPAPAAVPEASGTGSNGI